MSASWPMGICMAMVVIGCAMQKPAFSLDRVSAGEAGARRSGAPQSHPEWRDRFDVNKADLLPTGTNPYIPMQPGRVLKLKTATTRSRSRSCLRHRRSTASSPASRGARDEERQARRSVAKLHGDAQGHW